MFDNDPISFVGTSHSVKYQDRGFFFLAKYSLVLFAIFISKHIKTASPPTGPFQINFGLQFPDLPAIGVVQVLSHP